MKYEAFQESFIGFAYHRIVLNQQGQPCDYVFLEANHAFGSITGLAPQQIIGRRVTEILPNILKEELDFIEAYGKVALGGGKVEFEQYVKALDKHFKIVAFSPKPLYFWVNVLDVTRERKQLEEYSGLLRSLAENESQFQAIIDYLPIPLTIEDLKGQLLYINAKGLKLFDVKEPVLGQFHVLQQLSADFDAAAMLHEVLSGIVIEHEASFVTASGRKIWAISQGRLIQYQGEVCMLCMHHDITERKQMELALKNSETAYRLLFDNAAEAIAIIRDGQVKLCNHMAEMLSGYTKDELLEMDIFDLVDEQDRAYIREIQIQQRDQVQPDVFTFRFRTKQNELRWAEMKGVPAQWQNEPAILYFFSDVTARVETENRLKASEEQFRLLFENAAEAIFVVQDDRIQISNNVVYRYLGYQPEEVIGRSFPNFIHFEDREKCITSHFMRMRGDRMSDERLEFRLLKKTGQAIWVQSSGVRIQWEGRDAVQYFVVDVDERVRAAQALRTSEEKYRLITEFVSDIIWVFNISDYCLTYFSPAMEQVTGYTPEEAIALPIDHLIAPSSLKGLSSKINELAGAYLENPANPPSFLMEVQLVHKDGRLLWTETSGRLRENSNQELEIIGVMRDVEERKKAQEQIVYLSYHDQLTGLYNRRYYDEQLLRLDQEKRYPLTLILADMNGLKLTNDVFGHQAGDKLLLRVAEVLKSMCRAQDITARIGGDEFVILLPNTGEKTAEEMVRRIREALYGQQTEGNIVLSVSFGWAAKEREEQSFNTVFLEAENRMYLRKLTESVSMRNETIKLITNSLYRDQPDESQHSLQVGALCGELARALDMDENQVSELTAAGILHDIGKIGIDGALLNKLGELSEKERAALQLHAEKGYHILKETKEFLGLANYVLSHHERMDGHGYPRGLLGEDIPIQARVISIAEAYDAMTSGRVYSPRIGSEQAVSELKRNAGTQFDARIVRVFVEKVLSMDWEA